MTETTIRLKGTPEGLRLKVGRLPWDEVLDGLKRSLAASQGFFRGGKVIVELEGRALDEGTLRSLQRLLDAHELTLWAVIGGDAATERLVRAYGIRARLARPSEREAMQTAGATALFLQRTLRSGQSLQFPGDVTLIGDVNPGAELIAGGSVVVWGRVRGLVHAGALGDRGAVVCALDLNPAQLRIADLIGRPPEQRRRKPKPEMAHAEGEAIIVEAWRVKG